MAKPGYAQQKKREQAIALARSGNVEAACQLLKKICRKDRQDIESWMGMGVLLAQGGKFNEAIPYFRHVTNIRKDIVDAYINLSSCYASIQDTASSIATCKAGLEQHPDNIDLMYNLACMLIEEDELDAAQPLFSRCIELMPKQIDCYLHLGDIHRDKLDFDVARDIYRKALEISPGNSSIIAKIASTYITQGDSEEAYKLLAPLMENSLADTNAAALVAKIAAKRGIIDKAIDYLETSIRHAGRDDENLVRAHLALGSLYDKQGQHDQAFRYFKIGNSLKQTNYQPAEHSHYIDSLISIFNKEFIAQHQYQAVQELNPIFIVGMPRSGTTLVEQILCSHPSVFGAGELKKMTFLATTISNTFMRDNTISQQELARLADSYLDTVRPKLDKESVFTDKMPSNALRLGFINMLLPNARVIHCLRNPLDTCLSCYTLDFRGIHEYAYDLENLGHYYNEYRRIMKHWQQTVNMPIMDLRYETLVAEQKKTTHQLLEFCNLDWDPACLAFHENRRIAVTASNQQVRQPIYKGSMQRWRSYEKHLKPLIDALEPEYRREAGVEDWDY